MNLTLHLTERCNMNCTYCVNDRNSGPMSEEVLYRACDLAFSAGNSAGICFFGGEPLLHKELIYKAIAYCSQKSKETGKKIRYKMTTNGTLIDDEFLDAAARAGIEIGLSFDGAAQDICRHYADGRGTFADVKQNAGRLLRKMPHSYGMLTLAPQAVHKFYDSVVCLHRLGFNRVTATIAYGNRVSWTEKELETLESEHRRIAEYYSNIFAQGKRFFFSPFDSKIRECITGFNPAERCHLGFRQMPVAVDGKIYACTQFMNDSEYCLGNVFDGIDQKKQLEIAKKSSMPEECRECELNKRCTNSCGCMNRLETGIENKVSPLQCAYERMLIGICDRMAEEMFRKYPERFGKRFAK